MFYDASFEIHRALNLKVGVVSIKPNIFSPKFLRFPDGLKWMYIRMWYGSLLQITLALGIDRSIKIILIKSLAFGQRTYADVTRVAKSYGRKYHCAVVEEGMVA